MKPGTATATVLSSQEEMAWAVSAGDCGRLSTSLVHASCSHFWLCGHPANLSFSEPLSSQVKMGKAQRLPGVVGIGVHS